RMSVAITNCGRAGWVTDRSGYRYDPIDPFTSRPWPAMPAICRSLAVRAALAAGFDGFAPDACLVNRYEPGARLSLHQDRNERDFGQPIVSVSLGLSAVFLFGGQRRNDLPRRVRLESGDVVVWGGPARLVPAEAVDLHVDPAELRHDVRTGGELADGPAPLGVHVLLLAGVRPDAERPAKVVEDDRRAWIRPRERGDVRDLPVIAPRFERQLARRELGESSAEVVAQEEMLRRLGAVVGNARIGIPGRSQADAPEPAAACRDLRVEHRPHGRTHAKTGRADDSGRDARLAVEPGRAHRRDAVHELGLADRPQGVGAVGLEHRSALDEDRGDDVVPGADVLEDLVEQIARRHASGAPIPE